MTDIMFKKKKERKKINPLSGGRAKVPSSLINVSSHLSPFQLRRNPYLVAGPCKILST
jgi:hypothetical protein